MNPDTCTGHIVDPPCDWGTYTPSQTHWNDIGLKSNGQEEITGGFAYSHMIQIWRAANATNSSVIMWFWRPHQVLQEFEGLPYEFQPVVLPTPTGKCIESRVIDFCNEDIAVRRGDAHGSCDYEANAPKLLVASSMKTSNKKLSDAEQSPAHGLIQAMQLSEVSFDTMFKNWNTHDNLDGASAREVVCKWVGESHAAPNFAGIAFISS